jgi:hypothetical protein
MGRDEIRYVGATVDGAQKLVRVAGCEEGSAMDAERKMIGRAAALGITVGFTVLILSGCQSTGVVPMDQDSYFIGKKDGSPGIGVSLSNKAAVYREANDFCRKKGLEVKTLNVTVTPAMPARLGSTELQFRCVPPGSEAQPVAKDAD